MKFIDLSIIQSFSRVRMKRDFASFIASYLDVSIDNTPESRVFWMGKYLEKYEKEIPRDSLVFQLESDLIPVLAAMEEQGVTVDEGKLRDIGRRIREDMDRTEREIYEVVGEQFNINSPKQIQVILFEKLGIKPTKKNKTGYSVDTEVLEEIAKEYDIARLILEYRLLAKLDSTYITGLLKSIDPITKKIHTTYDSLGAATGRMSSNDPNLQNIPSGEGYAREIKECFVPSKTPLGGGDVAIATEGDFGKVPPPTQPCTTSLHSGRPHRGASQNTLLVADYSQVELRVLAFLSQDENLLDAFEKGEDIHTRTAKFLFGKIPLLVGEAGRGMENTSPNPSYKEGNSTWKPTSEQRRIAKTVNFGVIYGITGFGLAKTLECSPYEASQYIDAFYAKYPRVREYYDTLLENARKDGYVETYFGRRRYTPSINDANKTIRSIAEREAMNMPVQGTAADMIKLAMIELDAKIRDIGLAGSMILQVHDELVFDIPESEKEIFEKLVREVMEGVLTSDPLLRHSERNKMKGRIQEASEYGPFLRQDDGSRRFPSIVVDISTGRNWAEAK